MTMTPEFRRPNTRYILTRMDSGSSPDVAECATLADIYYALVGWFPDLGSPFEAQLTATGVSFWDEERLLASMREVFE